MLQGEGQPGSRGYARVSALPLTSSVTSAEVPVLTFPVCKTKAMMSWWHGLMWDSAYAQGLGRCGFCYASQVKAQRPEKAGPERRVWLRVGRRCRRWGWRRRRWQTLNFAVPPWLWWGHGSWSCVCWDPREGFQQGALSYHSAAAWRMRRGQGC